MSIPLPRTVHSILLINYVCNGFVSAWASCFPKFIHLNLIMLIWELQKNVKLSLNFVNLQMLEKDNIF